VKGIMEMRNLSEVPEVEAVGLAALRLLGSHSSPLQDEAEISSSPSSWADVKRSMLKPGHFVNALRRFPYAADRGQVPESDLCDVEEILAEVPPQGQGLAEIHPMAAHLFTWVRAALEYAAWSHTRLDSIASPARAGAAPAPPRPDAQGSRQPPKDSVPLQARSDLDNALTAHRTAMERKAVSSAVTATSVASSPPSGAGFGVSWHAAQAEVANDLGISFSYGSPAVATFHGGPSMPPAAFGSPGAFGGPPMGAGNSSNGYSQASPSNIRRRSPAASRTSPVRQKPASPQVIQAPDTTPLTPDEAEEYHRQLEQTRKEVRDIRALEMQVKWDMDREERREVETAKKEADVEIMQWREEQAALMRESMEEQTRIQKVEDLEASKEFQIFKREKKQAAREEELQMIKEQLQADIEFSQFQADIAKMAVVDKHALVIETLETIQDQREMRAAEVLREKQQSEQDRAIEQRATFNLEANKLAAEKEELLRSLQLMRQRQKVPVASNRGLATAGRAAKR